MVVALLANPMQRRANMQHLNLRAILPPKIERFISQLKGRK